MKYCGLDQALTSSGAAVLDGGQFVAAKSLTTNASKERGDRYHQFRDWWELFLDDHRPDYVAIEEPLRSDMQKTVVRYRPNDAFGQSVIKEKQAMTNMQTLLGLYGIFAIAQEVCAAMKVKYVSVNVQDWRQVIHAARHAPKGTTDATAWWKAKATERCRMLGWDVPSKDAAEAALIADWLRIKLTPVTRVRSGDLFAGAE